MVQCLATAANVSNRNIGCEIYTSFISLGPFTLFSAAILLSIKLLHLGLTVFKVTDSFDWLQSSLDTVVSKCVNRIHDDASLWQNNQPPPPPQTEATGNATTTMRTTLSTRTTVSATRKPSSLAESILNTVCPTGCSQKGHCVHRKCKCTTGYTGVDCSIPLSTPPQVGYPSVIHLVIYDAPVSSGKIIYIGLLCNSGRLSRIC